MKRVPSHLAPLVGFKGERWEYVSNEKWIQNKMIIFKLAWNAFITIAIVALFIPWWGFVFGSGIVAILILIFNPMLFLLPCLLAGFYCELD